MACRCGCGRPVAPDEGRRWQLDWMNAVAEPGDHGTLAERHAAGAALSVLEDAVRNWGCIAVLGQVGEWRERWDLATSRAYRAGLLSSGDPESRRLKLAEMDRHSRIAERSLWLWQMDMRPGGEAGFVYATPTADESAIAERAVRFARAKLPQYIARNVPRPVRIRWFRERAGTYQEPEFWGHPRLRGMVDDGRPRDGSMWIRVGLGDDLPATIAHELYHVGQPRSASDDHREDQERDAHQFSDVEFLADWQVNGGARGVTDLAARTRVR